jgi:integrase/recombinase XerD
MRGKPEGLFICTRHSPDCKHHSETEFDRDETKRCNCVKYILGRAADSTRFRESTGTASWERARKLLVRRSAEHDPVNKPLFGQNPAISMQRQTVKEAVSQFLDMKRGENVMDMAHYVGFLERQFLKWCNERGIHYLDELNLELLIKFRNSLKNKGVVRNRKVSKLRTFFSFCCDVKWYPENIAKKIKPSQEDEPDVDYFQPEEMKELENACFVSHTWHSGHDYEYRARRLRAFILFARWTGLAMIDCVRFSPDRLQQHSTGVWTVLLRRQKNGNPVFVGIPKEVVDAVTAIPPMSDRYFFWGGNGKPETAVKAWGRSLSYVFKAAKLKRNGRPLRCHPHMFRHTFAVEKLLHGTPLHEVSMLLGHHSIKVTERHYLKFDQRRQEQLIHASMSDWEQIQGPKPSTKKQRPKLVVMSQAAGK